MEVVDRAQRNFIEIMSRKYCNVRASWEMKLEIESRLNSSESLKSPQVHRLHSNALTSLCVGSFLYRSLIFGTATNSAIFSQSQIQIPYKQTGCPDWTFLFIFQICSQPRVDLCVKCSILVQSGEVVLGCIRERVRRRSYIHLEYQRLCAATGSLTEGYRCIL